MPKPRKLNFIKITNKKVYGKSLYGTKIYFEGRRPKAIKKDGTFSFGKGILEVLNNKFKINFWLIITEKEDKITTERGILRVRISMSTLGKMFKEAIERKKDINSSIIEGAFGRVFPEHFHSVRVTTYVPGTLSRILDKKILNQLSGEDRDAIVKFIPEFIASESHSSVNLLKAASQIESLRELAIDLEKHLNTTYSESWWQTYIHNNILIIQQGYIKALEKINIAIGNTKFPDFSLVTHDNYLDILEIKKPNTNLLKNDSSRGNYFWDTEMAKAIIQVENYINSISKHSSEVKEYILENFEIDLKVVRPRGIILAGNANRFETQKEKDDFRLLTQGLKNITILTYDELLIRLKNYISVLEKFVVIQ